MKIYGDDMFGRPAYSCTPVTYESVIALQMPAAGLAGLGCIRASASCMDMQTS
ncbi:MAG: hypothetical protein P8L70_15515 [Halioglobus sp.]|nr:hypothetical protein [Halioglobus sp.]MDG2328137.1 hypothetical protein [Halioglobus sp.]